MLWNAIRGPTPVSKARGSVPHPVAQLHESSDKALVLKGTGLSPYTTPRLTSEGFSPGGKATSNLPEDDTRIARRELCKRTESIQESSLLSAHCAAVRSASSAESAHSLSRGRKLSSPLPAAAALPMATARLRLNPRNPARR